MSSDSGNFGFMSSKKAQITIFIIIAIMIVAVIALFFIFRGNIIKNNVPKDLLPVYNYYLSCIDYEAKNGALLLGEGGGYINSLEFSPGSVYMPFSSQLGFLGNSIPYWYYVSGNGLSYEQIPTIGDMQEELDKYIEDGLSYCDFSSYEEAGYEVLLGEPVVTSYIKDNQINSQVKQDIRIVYGNNVWTGRLHSIETSSNLGKFYSLAKDIYGVNKQKMFLENYGVDILRLYAPVDGSDITCSPKIWTVADIRENLSQALTANTAFIKIKGDYYELSKKENKYFVQNLEEDTPFNVNFMYSDSWPMLLNVYPSEDGILRADPVGTQEGLGMLGFCYVPYHFIYDFSYPILIQIMSQDEMFQFPVVVVIDKNMPRTAMNGSSGPSIVPEICIRANTPITVNTYNVNLEPVSANIKFKCFDTTCDIGNTEIQGADSVLSKDFPQCGNGYIIASSYGYETKKELVSTINEGTYNIILDKKYKLNVEVKNLGKEIEGNAIITFEKENSTSKTLAYPETREIELSEGQYRIKAYVYSNTSIDLKGSTTQKCIDIPKGAILGMFGVTEEKCFDMQIPDQTVDIAVSGGGNQAYYISESELMDSNKLIIEPAYFGVPDKIQDIQNNYNLVDNSHINLYFEKE
jgi:hypothetical protein